MARVFLYRCPITGMSVQGHVAVDEGPIDLKVPEPLTCLSCGRIHLIDPNTGKLLPDTDNFKRR